VAVAIDNYANEVDTFYESPDTFVGAWAKVAGRGALYFGVDWREHDDALAPVFHVSFVALRKAAYIPIAKALELRYRNGVIANDDWWWVGIEAPINGRAAGHIEAQLGRMADSLLKKLTTINVRKLAQSR
jgi:hypothetical protein